MAMRSRDLVRPLAWGALAAAALFVADRALGGASSFARALAAAARADVGADAARIRALVAPYDPVSINWCALAVKGWIAAAAKQTGETPPVQGDGLAKEIMRQFQRAEVAGQRARWYSLAELRADPSLVREGMVFVATRGDPSGPFGHTGVVTGASGSTFTSAEGNACSASSVCAQTHDLADPSSSLLGMGAFL